jgi:hypothetical protein
MGLWFLGRVLRKNLPDKLSIDLVIDNEASAPFRRAVRKTFQRQVEYSDTVFATDASPENSFDTRPTLTVTAFLSAAI